MSIRLDMFKVGDKVEFVNNTLFSDAVINNHVFRYGMGPYTIERIEDVKEAFRSVGHVQFVYVNSKKYSGAWFKLIGE